MSDGFFIYKSINKGGICYGKNQNGLPVSQGDD